MNESAPIRWEGRGLHTGTPCAVEVKKNSLPGLRFTFGDREAFRVEEAIPEGDSRGSTLSFPNGIKIRTVEHLLSALAGVGLWDAEIRVEGCEIPALDGSADLFARKLAMLAEENKPCRVEPLRVDAPVSVRDAQNARALVVLPAETFGVSCVIDYPGSWIGTQAFCIDRLDSKVFLDEVAKAKTFCLESELEMLRTAGLGRGGDLRNTLVIGKGGPLNPEVLSFPDECVRHKVLDLIGDMALLGRPLVGHVLAFRSGHGLHLSLVSRLRRIAHNMKQEK